LLIASGEWEWKVENRKWAFASNTLLPISTAAKKTRWLTIHSVSFALIALHEKNTSQKTHSSQLETRSFFLKENKNWKIENGPLLQFLFASDDPAQKNKKNV
jgi:hypothetical protein